MKKKIYSLLLLLLTAFSGQAAEAKWCLVVESTGGETIAIAVDQKPVIKTVADGYELCYGESVTSFAWDQLKKLTLSETEPTAVKNLKAQTAPSVRLEAGEIGISGAEPGSLAIVYTAAGLQQLSARVDQNGSLTLSTTSLPAGIYIVKTSKSTFKIVKK